MKRARIRFAENKIIRNLNSIVFVLFILLFFNAGAQNVRSLTGVLQDSTGKVISDITVRLIIGRDTLTTQSNEKGYFSFSKIHSDRVILIIESLNFESIVNSYNFNENQLALILKPILLKGKLHILNEVLIKEKQVAIIIKKDTVEYNVTSYQKSKDDLLEDLLKRLPATQIDNDGNVKHEGKIISKLRVNGKDFFTGDLKEFLRQLPADIISKLQVIDDYGDEANFIGIKTGEPPKMLNLVIKPGINRGKFESAGLTGGSNSQYGVSGNGNDWFADKQLSFGADVNNTKNITGQSTSNSIATNYRNTFKRNLTIYTNYNYYSNKSDINRENYSQSIINSVAILNNSNNTTNQKNYSHNIKTGIEFRPNKYNYFTLNSAINIGSGEAAIESTSIQTGGIRQDLRQQSENSLNSPAFNVGISVGHHFVKLGRTVTMNFSFDENKNFSKNRLIDTIGYYDINGDHSKDSLSHRLINSNLNNNTISAKLVYSEPITKNSNVDFLYKFGQNSQNNNLVTDLFNQYGNSKRVDSLSNSYFSSFITHLFNTEYRYNNNKFRVIGGISFQSTILAGQTVGLSNEIKKRTINLTPVISLVYISSKKNTIGFNYTSNAIAPNYKQLSPIVDSRNLQNVIVGNPLLKPSFNHQLNLNLKHITLEGGSLNLSFGGGVVQNKIVSNIILKPDTLNSLKQETHFLNANGSYNVNGNYYLSIPVVIIGKQKYNINLNGNASYAYNTYFTNSILAKGGNLNLNQSANTTLDIKKILLALSSTYTYIKNQFAEGTGINTMYQTLQFSLATGYSINPNLTINVLGDKSINTGDRSIFSKDPLIINASIRQKLFKKKTGDIQLQAFDLLNQTNNLIRTVSDNSITDSHINYITRYIKIMFTMHLSKFGK